MHGNSKIKVTPAINRRIEQLRIVPTTSNNPLLNSPMNYTERQLNLLDTPTREQVMQKMQEMENETPQTKRRRQEEEGYGGTPEYATTPYFLEKRRQFEEERRMRHMPSESEIKRIKEKTVNIFVYNEFYLSIGCLEKY